MQRFLILSLLIWLVSPGHAAFVTPHDTVPHFAATPSIVSVQDGRWHDPATWNTGRIPGPTDVVHVRHDVVIDAVGATARIAGIAGTVLFAPTVSTSLHVGTLQVEPGGALIAGTEAQPVTGQAEIVFRNLPLPDADGAQWGGGLIAINATVSLYGRRKTPWMRLVAAPHSGETTLVFAEDPMDWMPGDRLAIPDTELKRFSKRNPPTLLTDIVTLVSLSGTVGSLVGTVTPLAYDHSGPLTPHVANLTRTVVLRSESPLGTRGHAAFLHRSAVTVAYTAVVDLGRTTIAPLGPDNVAGRYALHAHRLYGPLGLPDDEPQSMFIGNVIERARKWGLVLHDTHYSLVQGNVVLDAAGAGIVTEDGSETANRFLGNFSMDHHGSGEPVYKRSRNADFGHEGAAYWFRSLNAEVRGNVAASALTSCYNLMPLNVPTKSQFGEHPPITIPACKGCDKTQPGQGREVIASAQPILAFADNEGYACENGLELWEVNAVAHDGQRESVSGHAVQRIEGLTVWNVLIGVRARTTNAVDLVGAWMQAAPSGASKGFGQRPCRMVRNFRILDSVIRGFRTAVWVPSLIDEPFEQGGGQADPFVVRNTEAVGGVTPADACCPGGLTCALRDYLVD